MDRQKVTPVILCGGSGSRLWPVSRQKYPKQLLSLAGSQTMLQDTVSRLSAIDCELADPVVVCNDAQRFLVAEQLSALGVRPRFILEPEGRNTAPAVTLAARLAADGDDSLLLVLPADHLIGDEAKFALAVEEGARAAASGALVTFGIVPAHPETGYGYIRSGEGIGEGTSRRVAEFVEKPDLDTARAYLESGDYFWNSGIFLFGAVSWLEQLQAYAADISGSCEQAFASGELDDDVFRPETGSFLACRKDSIDYAVMEKTDRAVVVPLDAGWSDVGSWASLHEVSGKDESGNVEIGDVTAVDCRDSYLRSESRLLGAVGLNGCVVIETKDAVLVAPQDRAQDVKLLVDRLAQSDRPETELGREVFRPWGSYDSLDSAPGYQVKRLTVLPGAILSLQLHHQRAEHWVVVSGMARITLDDDVFDLNVNEHVFIPVEARHRIENPGKELLHIIEVQVGSYLGEDDIVRFEDKYGRTGRTD